MFKVAALISLFVAGAVQAQECKPVYTVQYDVCAHPSNPVSIQSITTEWILVNKGARRVSNGICTDHTAAIAGQNPTATNVEFAEIKDEDATQRGIGKRDVYCKFKMSKPMPIAVASPACGIANATPSCFNGVEVTSVKECAAKIPASEEEQWQKAACLLDSLKYATQIRGLDEVTYDSIKFQLRLLRDSMVPPRSTNDAKLLAWIKLQLRN